MDPFLKSWITSLALGGAGVATGWAVKQGWLDSSQADAATSAIGSIGVGAATTVVGLGLAWYKAKQHTPRALVEAVNSPAVPGVKVVRENSASPTVTVTSGGVVLTSPPAPLPADAKPGI